MKRKVIVNMDLIFGSSGKGALAAYLAEVEKPDTIVTQWMPNSGHTSITRDGHKLVHTMLANGINSPNLKRIFMGPGSAINVDNLLAEIENAKNVGLLKDVKIYLHGNAAMVYQIHRDLEAGPMTKIGSTRKGCGEAMIHKIHRNPDDMNVAFDFKLKNPDHEIFKHIEILTVQEYNKELDKGEVIMVESSQGYSLSIHHGMYPFTTSRDVTTAQVLADCGIPFGSKWADIKVIGCTRTFPIRVANRFDESGVQVGYSGPVYEDQKEIKFEDIGQAVELTTVTKLPRRIFTFSKTQIAEAIRQCGVDEVFLNFANYCKTKEELDDIINKIESTGVPVKYLGYGPEIRDIIKVE